jgi:hypothetical protein
MEDNVKSLLLFIFQERQVAHVCKSIECLLSTVLITLGLKIYKRKAPASAAPRDAIRAYLVVVKEAGAGSAPSEIDETDGDAVAAERDDSIPDRIEAALAEFEIV